MRALVRFGKKKRLSFISHLDLQRYMQMALRRTNLPIAYSQGFNPHPQISFASALAMGHTSEYEVLDIKLAGAVEPSQLFEQMRGALPSDLPVIEACLVEDRCPAMMALVAAADYEIVLDDENVGAWVSAFLEKKEVLAMRKTKSGETEVDIRPMVTSLRADGAVLSARLALTERATVKPDLLVRTLAGEDYLARHIHRKTLLKEQNGEYVPLLEGFS